MHTAARSLALFILYYIYVYIVLSISRCTNGSVGFADTAQWFPLERLRHRNYGDTSAACLELAAAVAILYWAHHREFIFDPTFPFAIPQRCLVAVAAAEMASLGTICRSDVSKA